jgi:alpha-ketoglutarate-dependent taurine dioxygenase
MTATQLNAPLDTSVRTNCLVVLPYRDGIADDIAELLEIYGAVKLTGMRDADQLGPLAERLGEIFLPILQDSDQATPASRDSQIYEVRVKNNGEGELDRYQETILSSVKDDFALHTDGYNQPRPPKYMLLLRTDDSAELPATYLADAASLLARLADEELELLSRPIYPTAEGNVSALTVKNGKPKVRWNAELVQRWMRRSDSDPAALERAIEVLGRQLSDVLLIEHLHQHECLILDNDRWLHGRSALQPDSVRVLMRAWVAR